MEILLSLCNHTQCIMSFWCFHFFHMIEIQMMKFKSHHFISLSFVYFTGSVSWAYVRLGIQKPHQIHWTALLLKKPHRIPVIPSPPFLLNFSRQLFHRWTHRRRRRRPCNPFRTIPQQPHASFSPMFPRFSLWLHNRWLNTNLGILLGLGWILRYVGMNLRIGNPAWPNSSIKSKIISIASIRGFTNIIWFILHRCRTSKVWRQWHIQLFK